MVKLTFSLVLDALFRRTHVKRSVLASVHLLVGLISAHVARISGNLDARLHVRDSGDNSLDQHETADLVRAQFPHLGDLLL